VFEGEISEAKLKKLKFELSQKLNLEEDSVIIYNFQSRLYSQREILGVEKNNLDRFI